MKPYFFQVDITPYSCYDVKLKEKNIQFLESIDYSYYLYTARIHSENLQSEDHAPASISLRMAYHHCIETLFSLIGATLQAPQCIYGWILKASIDKTRNIVRKISQEKSVPNTIGIDEISWHSISSTIHDSGSQAPQIETALIAEKFGKLWSFLAHEFLSEINIKEYNSIKHGFRAGFGGFKLTFFEPSNRDNILLHNENDSGTSYLSAERIKGSPLKASLDPNFITRTCNINWTPMNHVHFINLIAFSINNIVSYLKLANNSNATECRFLAPKDLGYFEEPFSDLTESFSSFTTVEELNEDDVFFYTRNDIRKILVDKKLGDDSR